jgi:hypothetical protein
MFWCRPHFRFPCWREVAHEQFPIQRNDLLYAQVRRDLPTSNPANNLSDDGPRLRAGEANERRIVVTIRRAHQNLEDAADPRLIPL